jgi:hypothetical protein
MQEQLIFLVSAPRSGSTLLERMLGAHSAIAGGPEPHLMPPLAHLGFFGRVDAAPYDPIITEEAARELVARLPAGEADLLDAYRAYTDHVYRLLLETQAPKSRLLDKTPAYALVLPFLARLYPHARYVVLTRTPLAILSSFANSFFDGDFDVATRHNPILERYVPAIARFLREQPAPLLHVRYEPLVENPRQEMQRIFDFLELDFEPDVIEYGSARRDGPGAASATGSQGLGDPLGVAKHDRPVTTSVAAWAEELASDEHKRSIALRSLERLEDADLETWGYDRGSIRDTLSKASPGGPVKRKPLNRYTLQRKLLVTLRRNIHQNAFGGVVKRVRRACDILLR